VIADDHQAIRVAVRDALEHGGCDVVGEADNAQDAVRLAAELGPDAVLLDVAMPGSGLWAVRQIVSGQPDCRVLMLTVSESSADLMDALHAGAIGYLIKDVTPEEIPAAVHSAVQGGAVLSGPLVARVLGELRRSHTRFAEVTNTEGHRVWFTERETEVLALLVDGLTTSQIAERLFVRPITVRRHIADAMHKLRVTSREEGIALLSSQVSRWP
jgi:DNA-binding NarL/FixJ family response regulator